MAKKIARKPANKTPVKRASAKAASSNRSAKATAKKPVAKSPASKKTASKKTPSKKTALSRKVTKKATSRATPRGASRQKKWGRRADLGADTAAYFAAMPADLRALAQRAHDAFLSNAGVSAAIKWGMPVYEVNRTMFGSVWKGKGYVRLGLYTGASVHDPKGLLEGEGKGHRHVKLRPDDPPAWSEIERLIRASTGMAKNLR